MVDEGRNELFFYEPAIVIRSRRRRRHIRKPRWTTIFIAICVFMFFSGLFLPFDKWLAFTPTLAFKQPWTFVTSVFLHADIMHLFFNMFALFMFGLYLEARVTEKQFLTIFFVAGIMGNIAYWLTDPSGIIPAVGASGAIYGIMGMLAILYPGLIVYIGYVPMPMIFAAVIWFLMEFTGMFTPSNIAHQAHLAGLIIGALYGFYVRKQRRKTIFFWER